MTVTVFVDRLTLQSAAVLRRAGVSRAMVLDELKGPAAVYASRLRASGVSIGEASFHAGSLRTPAGEAVYLTARRMTAPLALAAALRLVNGSPTLRSVNRAYGRDTLRLYIAKAMALELESALLRLIVARALATTESIDCWLHAPATYPADALDGAIPGVRIRWYASRRAPLRRLARLVAVEWLRRMRAALTVTTHESRPARSFSVLVAQEDDILADRSYRGQLHWLDPEHGEPSFATYVVPRGGPHGVVAAPAFLQRLGVRVLSRGDVSAFRRMARHPALAPLQRDRRGCLRECIRACLRVDGGVEALALLNGWILCGRALELAGVMRATGARVFLSSEPYIVEVDAAQLVAAPLGVTTIVQQYSSLALLSTPMLSTPDHLVLFSKHFRKVFEISGVGPATFDCLGYPFDNVPSLVRPRAMALRASLETSGAKYVVCLFDESVQRNRWGLIDDSHHHAEVKTLAAAVVDDPSMGAIVKCKLSRNAPSARYPDDETIVAAVRTGRFVELGQGSHRNNVFPVEAALASDLCIGHLIGATAALESALAGRRAVLLNPHGAITAADAIYQRALIVFSNIDEVLQHTRVLRSGEPAVAALGDWSSILSEFDPHRDGQASARLRDLIETVVGQPVTTPVHRFAGTTI